VGSDNTAFGFAALQNTTQGGNTATGSQALLGNCTGFNNTADGAFALQSNTTGESNTAIGTSALENNNDNFNTAVGAGAMFLSTSAFRNTAVGAFTLENLTTGFDNIAIGFNAGLSVTTEARNINIDNEGVAGESSTIRIGNFLHSQTFIAGISGVTVTGTAVVVNGNGQLGVQASSARFKQDIQPMNSASEALLSLKPVTFRYKKEIDPAGTSQFGLLAEEVEKIDPALVVRDRDGKPFTVRYDQVNAMLLNEFLKEHRKVQELEVTVAQQQENFQATLTEQEKRIEVLTSGLQKLSAQVGRTKPEQQMVANTP
jgi:trimeric autotransporter adhesin